MEFVVVELKKKKKKCLIRCEKHRLMRHCLWAMSVGPGTHLPTSTLRSLGEQLPKATRAVMMSVMATCAASSMTSRFGLEPWTSHASLRTHILRGLA
jgi:hypothetical protein